MLIAMCPVRIIMTCVLFSAGLGDGKWPRFNSVRFRLVFSCCSTCLLRYHSYDAFSHPQIVSDPSFHPFVMFLALFLAVCCRLAVILVHKARPDGSSTVGKITLATRSRTPKCIRSFVSSIRNASCLVFGRLSLLFCYFGPQGSSGRDRPRPVGKSLLRRVSGPPKCIRSFVTSVRNASCVVSGRLSSLGCHFGPQGSSGRIVHGRLDVFAAISLTTRFRTPKMHPILRYVHTSCFMCCSWPFVVAWLPFWSSRSVRTDRPRSAIKAPNDVVLETNTLTALSKEVYEVKEGLERAPLMSESETVGRYD
jgi:hypothetical protein